MSIHTIVISTGGAVHNGEHREARRGAAVFFSVMTRPARGETSNVRRGRVEDGRGSLGPYGHRPVSHPRSSNRACRFPAPGFRGSRLRRDAYITTSWQLHLPISWRGSLGLCWHKVAATKRASSQQSHAPCKGRIQKRKTTLHLFKSSCNARPGCHFGTHAPQQLRCYSITSSATTKMRHSEAKHPGRPAGVGTALRPLGRTHHTLDHHGRDAREYGLGHWGCQDVGDRT